MKLIRDHLNKDKFDKQESDLLKGKDNMPIKKALLSDNLKEKFNKLHSCKSFEERTAIL